MSEVLFYNAGDKIDEVLTYSIPMGQDIHCVARWGLVAPKENFFEVPSELEDRSTGATIAVQFPRDIELKFGHRGVVRVDGRWDPEKEDPEKPLVARAPSRETAIARGRELWQLYLRKIVEGHLADCEAARAAGGAPKSAVGFTKRAMKLLGIKDPGEQYFNSLMSGEQPGARQDGIVAGMQAQISTMFALMMAMASGEKLDAAKLAEVMKMPAIGASTDGKPVTSGVATGKITKPITNVGGVDHELPQARGKNTRAAEAEKALQGD